MTGPKPLYWFLLFAMLFSIQVLPRLSQDSLAGDENRDIVDGFYYWQGDVISTQVHPPLAKALQALPLRFMGLKSRSDLQFAGAPMRDAYFISVLNRDHFDQIVFWSRFVSFLFGLSLGFMLFYVSQNESPVYVLTLMTLWAFGPSFLAYSGFALAALPMTFFFFIALLSFDQSLMSPSLKKEIAAGVLVGMTVTAKFTGFLLLPVFLILELKKILSQPRSFVVGPIFRRWSLGFLGAFLWVGFLYLPGTFSFSNHPLPWTFFIEGLRAISKVFSFPYYFEGVLSRQNHWNYYPTVFLLKTPLTLLILFFVALILSGSRIIRIPLWQWIPIPVFFLAFLFFHDVGLRMILPIYPFCILIAAKAGDWMASRSWSKEKTLPLIWASLLIFQVYKVGSHFPEQLSYFNSSIRPDRKIYWLGDSNLDIGQDTKRLAEVVKTKGWRHVKLAYFGTDDPKLYGMDWSYWTQKDLKGPQSGWVYAVNDEFLQMGPAYTPAAAAIGKSWIANRPPDGTIGDTWRYYEIPGPVLKDSSPAIASAPFFIDQRPVLVR